MRIHYNKIIGYVFEHLCNTKNIKGTINECLIAGNLAKYGYDINNSSKVYHHSN